MMCFNCNNEISETDKFCKHCGICLDYPEETVKLNNENNVEIIKDEIVASESQYNFCDSSIRNSLEEYKEYDESIMTDSRPKKMKIVFIFVSLMLVVGLIFTIFEDQINHLLFDLFQPICCIMPREGVNSNKLPNQADTDSLKANLESIEKYLDSLIVDTEEYVDVSTKFQELDYLVIFNNDKFIQKRG